MDGQRAEAVVAPSRGWARRALVAATALAALGGLATLALTLSARAGFAWPLEWMEGASVQHARLLQNGRLPYLAPHAEFIAYLYPPLAYVPMIGARALFGAWLPAARAVSLACTLLSLAVIARSGVRAGGPLAGLCAAGLFAVGFGYTGAFLDLARVDACFVLLLLLGAERLGAERPRAALVWFALSALAKQHGLLLLAAASAALLVQAPRRNAWMVGAVWAALGLAFAWLQYASAGWFGRYVFALPASQPLSWPLLFSFVPIDLCVYLPVLAGAAAYAVWRRYAARTLVASDAVLLAAIVAGALGRAHAGGHDNVRLPAFALLCVAGVPPLARALTDAAGSLRRSALAGLAICAQFAILWQPPSSHAPPRAGAQQFTALSAALERCANGGSTVALDYAGLGSEPFLHTMALSDLRMSGDPALAQRATGVLLDALRGPYAPRALAVGERFPALDRALAENYRECARVVAPEPATGYRPGLQVGAARVQVVYVLIAARSVELGPI